MAVKGNTNGTGKKKITKRNPILLGIMLVICGVATQISCTQQIPENLQDMNFIPQPVSVDTTEGAFVLKGKAMVYPVARRLEFSKLISSNPSRVFFVFILSTWLT